MMIQDGFQPCEVSFSTCIKASMKNGNMTAARHWLTKMFESGIELNDTSYSTLIHAGIKAGDPRFSACIMQHLESQNKHIQPVTYRAYIHALAKNNQSGEAMMHLERMVQTHGLELITADEMFGPVISSFCNNQNDNAVLEWLEKMKQWNVHIPQTIYTKAIRMLQRTGNNKWARELCQEMNNATVPNAGPQTYSAHHAGRRVF